ncbi:MAG: hypothetical protein OQJ89_09345 [Kangiellaceae bacterium]|nr:hypothetical protein [Kangiellaceae bacterium]
MIRKIFASIVGFLFISATVHANVENGSDENDVMLTGHDAVAYFAENKPVLGSADFTAVHNGAIYRFSSASNRDIFKADPAKYAPMYGGYCSFGTSIGKKFDVDGKSFKVVDGKLYVNKNVDVGNHWSKDIAGNIKNAEGYWPKIKSIAPDKL